jgi:hypothetical protein
MVQQIPYPTAWLMVLTIVLTVALHASRTRTIILAFTLQLILLGLLQFVVRGQEAGLFVSHWMYGSVLLRAGTEALRSKCGLVQVSPASGLLAVAMLVGITVNEVVVTRLNSFHNHVHMLIYSLGAAVALSACAESLVGYVFRATRTQQADFAVRSVRPIRQVFDPACFFAMGLVLLGHEHDHYPLAIRFHTAFGLFLINLALSIFLCSIAHDALPPDSAVCATMRRAQSFAWLLTGGITMAMCVVLPYLSQHYGFKPYLESRRIQPQTIFEEATAYVAATIFLCAVHLALLQLSSPPQLASPGAKAHFEDSVRAEPPACGSANDEAEPMI